MRVLVAEDDCKIREGLVEILTNEGYEVTQAKNGDEAVEIFTDMRPDFVCLDVMMPGKSGFDVCKEIRKLDEDVPVVFISAKSEEIDKVIGLELGADDYILKPFGVKEVVARIRAITRRALKNAPKEFPNKPFTMGDLEVVPRELLARRGKTDISLSLRELKILELFCRKRGEVLDRDALFNGCWGEDYFPNSRTLDQHISKLRKKIEQNPKDPKIIETVHGTGYCFR